MNDSNLKTEHVRLDVLGGDPDEPEWDADQLEQFLEDPDRFLVRTDIDGFEYERRAVCGPGMEKPIAIPWGPACVIPQTSGDRWLIEHLRDVSAIASPLGGFHEQYLRRQHLRRTDLGDDVFLVAGTKKRLVLVDEKMLDECLLRKLITEVRSGGTLAYARFADTGEFVHRSHLLWGRKLATDEHVDHIDGNGLNNLFSNLQPGWNPLHGNVNAINRSYRKDSDTPVYGVSRTPTGKWRVRLNIKGEDPFDKTFLSIFEAARERDDKLRNAEILARFNDESSIRLALQMFSATYPTSEAASALCYARSSRRRYFEPCWFDSLRECFFLKLSNCDELVSYREGHWRAQIERHHWYAVKNTEGEYTRVEARINGKKVKMVDLIVVRELPKGNSEIHHHDENPFNNCAENLIELTKAQHNALVGKRKNAACPANGVHRRSSGNYAATICAKEEQRPVHSSTSLMIVMLINDYLVRNCSTRRGARHLMNWPDAPSYTLEEIRSIGRIWRPNKVLSDQYYRGVRRARGGGYIAYITLPAAGDGPLLHLKQRADRPVYCHLRTIDSPTAAARAHDAEASRIFGSKAVLNFPPMIADWVLRLALLPACDVLEHWQTQKRVTDISARRERKDLDRAAKAYFLFATDRHKAASL
jgi:hypothetical protein